PMCWAARFCRTPIPRALRTQALSVPIFGIGTVLLSPVVAQARQEPSVRVGSASNQRSDGWQAKRKSVAIKDGKLSVNAQGRSLRSVLNEISRDACVAVTGAGSVDDSPVSVQFQDLPIDEGLRRILTHYDTFFFYRAGQSGPPMLAAIWIYPKGQAQGVVPVPPEEWAGTKELEAMRADPDPETRARAVQTLIERKPAQAAANILAESLRDQDDRV